ncbi:MAG: ATP-binding protein [Herbinix sp.]|nr:ATP-binding protein [Herbinix sp.]
MKSLKSRLSLTILVIVLLTVGIISIFSNYFINKQFTDYLSKQQELKTQVITSSISNMYSTFTDTWNMDYIHAVGMNSLYEGYIIKVYDKDNQIIWDAQSHNMTLCNQIMDDISNRMQIQYPQMNGEFTAVNYPLTLEGETIGSVSISYFGPFFLNENDFEFLHSLNTILVSVGLVSLIVSAIVGQILAKRISQPILKTVEVTKQIADGNYEVRLEEDTNTIELNMLVDSINHLAVSLETLEQLRKQLTEDVAHELRTPISILGSYLEAMTDGVWEPTEERLGSCYDEVMRMGKLVGDLEKLAKIESQNLKLDRQWIDLYEIVDKIVHNFQGEIANKQLQVSIDGPHTSLMADQNRLSQVVVNLISNAVKYSKEGSSISVILFETEDTAGFHVQDHGIGISEEELPYIFERFYRADKSRNRATGGSGIGLTIVKAIVEAHGGRVSVESNRDEGSKFTVILPKE